MRKPVVIFLALCAVGLLSAVAVAATKQTSLAFTLGVTSGAPIELKRGETICQKPINVPGDGEFDRVAFQLGTYQKAGPELEVLVQSGSKTIASGFLPGGYLEGKDGAAYKANVHVGKVSTNQVIDVCIHNAGQQTVAVYGNADVAHFPSSAYKGETHLGVDMNLQFMRSSRSLLSLLPTTFDRASLFHTSWTAPWVFWLLLGLLAVGTPLLLAAALRSALRSDPPSSS